MMPAPLPEGFHPLVTEWFAVRYGAPTPVQEASWPRILAGEHVLLTAPTGSGKTLTAFLSAINALLSGNWPTGELCVLYVSPLKALNNDIQRNLLAPLHELRELADSRGVTLPQISVATRSGDTPSSERRQMLRRPPEILITTPESLNIVLSSPRARAMLATVKTVVLDEIHAVVGNKRGTHLITAIERIVPLAGEFQRIAISATVAPLDLVARFVGGMTIVGDPRSPSYRRRDVTIVRAADTKRIELVVDYPDTDVETGRPAGIWPHLVRELRAIIGRNRSTLIFVTTRRHAEKLTLLINEGAESPIAYSHHGSLSRELRLHVERALKSGELRAIVATNSLELGIDIGALDEVVMVKTPSTVSSTLQRLGRAGHRVGETSRGTIFPLYGRDMIDAAAMSTAALDRDIEEVRPVVAPLDVLAQIIVSMTAMARWNIDELYASICAAWPYHQLERRSFDLVIEMLAGRYAETRIRELRPRISLDRVTGGITAREGMTALLYQSGGTIPDRGYYALRMEGGGQVGELDEEFVWERRVGETFVFGSQSWTIHAITERDVVVVPAGPDVRSIPFWRAEARGRDAHYSHRLLDLLEACDGAIESGTLERLLEGYPHLTPRLRTRIVLLLEAQRRATGTRLPHRHHIVVENVVGAPRRADEDTQEIIVHCGWGGRVNEPLAIAFAALWEREYGYPLEVYADNDALVLLLPSQFSATDALSPARFRELLRRGNLEALLRERLERSARFGALFRENAGRALLLPRGGFSRRMPLWLNRLRSKKLLESTSKLPDFPILLETWRNCLFDEFDLAALRELMEGVANGQITVSTCETVAPSPFASDLVWQQTNAQMYKDDSLPGVGRSELSDQLLREAVLSDSLRPMIPRQLVARVEERLARRAAGYAPAGGEEIVEWITERVIIPAGELDDLRTAVVRDHGHEAWSIGSLADRVVWICCESNRLLVARNRLPSLVALYGDADVVEPDPSEWDRPPQPTVRSGGRTLGDLLAELAIGAEALPSPDEVLAEILRFYGPVSMSLGHRQFGLGQDEWSALISTLREADVVVVGQITEGTEELQVCETETLEYLLRVNRAASRPVVEPVPATALVPLWAGLTMLGSDRADPDRLVELLDLLFGYGAPAASWEGDLIPARLDEYYPLWLDALFAENGLVWLGCGPERICFSLAAETRLFRGEHPRRHRSPVAEALQEHGPAEFLRLVDLVAGETSPVTAELWAAAWDGQVSNSTFQTVRRGVETRFTASSADRRVASVRRRTYHEWRATRPLGGTWFAIEETDEDDPISVNERDRERARVLLRRYGVVFRELAQREGEPFAWRSIFRALRLLELAGEVVSGVFVTGVSTPQFALRSAIGMLAAAPASSRIVWMSAVDPASPCGLGLAPVYGDLPSRTAGNHLVFRGSTLVMCSRRNGREITLHVDPEDADLPRILAPLRHLVTRRWNALARVVVETVNGRPIRESEYAPLFRTAGFRDEYRTYVLSAPYR